MIWLRQLFDNWLPLCSLGILKEHVNHIWNATVLTPLTTTIRNLLYHVYELAQKSAFLSISPGKQWWSPRFGHHGREGLSLPRFRNWTFGLLSCTVATSVTLGKLLVVFRMSKCTIIAPIQSVMVKTKSCNSSQTLGLFEANCNCFLFNCYSQLSNSF